MGFLDNLESAVNAAEVREEGASQRVRDHRNRESMRAQTLAAASNASALKTSRYTNELLGLMNRLGHARRIKVRVAWIGPNLRFEARDRRLELRPTAEGIFAVYGESGADKRRQLVNLDSEPEKLAKAWLASIPDPAPMRIDALEH